MSYEVNVTFLPVKCFIFDGFCWDVYPFILFLLFSLFHLLSAGDECDFICLCEFESQRENPLFDDA